MNRSAWAATKKMPWKETGYAGVGFSVCRGGVALQSPLQHTHTLLCQIPVRITCISTHI